MLKNILPLNSILSKLSELDIYPKPFELGSWNSETIFTTPCVSHVTCHLSCVMCHVSHVTCPNEEEKINQITKNGAASWWRVYYEQGLPCLVSYGSVQWQSKSFQWRRGKVICSNLNKINDKNFILFVHLGRQGIKKRGNFSTLKVVFVNPTGHCL